MIRRRPITATPAPPLAKLGRVTTAPISRPSASAARPQPPPLRVFHLDRSRLTAADPYSGRRRFPADWDAPSMVTSDDR